MNEISNKNDKTSKSSWHMKAARLFKIAIAIFFVIAFAIAPNEYQNSNFLFQSPVHHLILTMAVAVFGMMASFAIWDIRGKFDKGEKGSDTKVFAVVLLLFFVSQLPFQYTVSKFQVLAAEVTAIDVSVKAAQSISNDPTNGITKEVKAKLVKEIIRDGYAATGDLTLHKQIK